MSFSVNPYVVASSGTDIATFFGLAYSVLSLIYGALLLRRNFSTPVGRLLGATVSKLFFQCLAPFPGPMH